MQTLVPKEMELVFEQSCCPEPPSQKKLEVIPKPEASWHARAAGGIASNWLNVRVNNLLEFLLPAVNYNFERGLVYYCVICNMGIYQDKNSVEDWSHRGHRWLQMHSFEGFVCVNVADIESVGVNTQKIQKIGGSVPGMLSVFLHNTFGYAYDNPSKTTPFQNFCVHCGTRLLHFCWINTRFCSLECQFLSEKESCAQARDLLKSSVPREPPRLEQMTSSRTSSRTSLDSMTDELSQCHFDEAPSEYLLFSDPPMFECRLARLAQSSETAKEKVSTAAPTVRRCKPVQPVQVIIPEPIPGFVWEARFSSSHPSSRQDMPEVDQLSLPEALHEERHVLSSPSKEVHPSMHQTTARRSLASPLGSLPEDRPALWISSDPGDSKSMDSCNPDSPLEGVFTSGTLRFVRKGLGAACCSSSVGDWRRHDPNPAERETIETVGGLRRMPKFTNGHFFRNAADGCQFHDTELQGLANEVDANYSEGSSSSGDTTDPDFCTASPAVEPAVESFRVEGPIDVTSLKQLVTTFDPMNWKNAALKASNGQAFTARLPGQFNKNCAQGVQRFSPTMTLSPALS